MTTNYLVLRSQLASSDPFHILPTCYRYLTPSPLPLPIRIHRPRVSLPRANGAFPQKAHGGSPGAKERSRPAREVEEGFWIFGTLGDLGTC